MNSRAAAIVTVLVMLLGLTAWFVFQDQDDGVDAADRHDTSTAESSNPLDGKSKATGSRDNLAEKRQTDDTGTPPRDAKDRIKVIVRGRVVARENKQPLAGCRVQLKIPNVDYYAKLLFFSGLAPEDLHLEDRVTAADGRFEFGLETPTYLTFQGIITASGRVRSEAWFEGFKEPVVNLGDISLQKGVTVQGALRNRKGEPVAGVGVYADGPDQDYEGAFSDLSIVEAKSGAGGEFEFQTPLYPGDWMPLLKGRFLEKPDKFVVADKPMQVALTCYGADELPKIRGRIADQHGVAIPSVDVDFEPSGNYRITWQNESDANGRFVIEKRPDDPEKVTVSFKANGCAPKHLQDVTWGGKPLVVEMQRAPSLDLTVREVGSGAPVEWFGVLLSHHERFVRHLNGMTPMLTGKHPGGRLSVDRLRPGKNLLMVVPRDKRFACPDFVSIDVVDANSTVSPAVVELHEKVSRRARVVRPDGSPVAGTQVALLVSACGKPVTLKTRFTKPVPLDGSTLAADQGVLLYETTTDKDGYATLLGDPRVDYSARVIGYGHLPRVQTGVRVDPQLGDLEIRVDGGATIEGRIDPPNLAQMLMPTSAQMRAWKKRDPDGFTANPVGVMASSQGKPRQPASGGLRIGKDGTFRFQGLPPGDWRIGFFWMDLTSGESWGHGMTLAQVKNLTARETRRITIDLRHLVPTTVTGTVLLNGAPLVNDEVMVMSHDGETRIGSRSVKTNDKGQFTYRTMAGRWRTAVWRDHPDDGDYSMLLMSDIQDVVPGRAQSRTFHIASVRAAFVVVAPDGKPVEGCRLDINRPGQRRLRLPPTSTSGETFMPHVMLGEYEVELRSKDGKKVLPMGKFTATKGGGPKRLVVPEGAGY